MLSRDMWMSDLTVEHVCPQKRSSEGWDLGNYENVDLVDYLGNLTLVPSVSNSLLSNKSWEQKRTIYKILSSPNLDALKENIDENKDKGDIFTNLLNITDNGEKIIENAPYLPQLKSISEIQGDWKPEIIKKRSENMADIIWDRMVSWIDWE